MQPGTRIGKRTVLREAPSDKRGRRVWVRCDCGKVSSVPTRKIGARCRSCARSQRRLQRARSRHRCRICQEPGHNARTCPSRGPCSYCGSSGVHESHCVIPQFRKRPWREESEPDLDGVYCMRDSSGRACGNPAVEIFRGICVCRNCLCQPWD